MSAEDPTVAEMLTAVNAAIYALIIKKVASYTINGRSYVYRDLDELRLMRSELLKENRSASSMMRLADISG